MSCTPCFYWRDNIKEAFYWPTVLGVPSMASYRFFTTTTSTAVLLIFVLSHSSANEIGRKLRFGSVRPNDCEWSNPCLNGGTCINWKKNVKCKCPPGYDGRTCADDVDECANWTDQCEQDCFNNYGGYTCGCSLLPGYELGEDGFSCVDTDECATATHECDQLCSNTIGSYQCACDIGYELNGDGRTCDDIDECATATDECDQVCASNTIGSYTCACDIAGYELSGDGRTCDASTDTDIDECATGTDDCDQVCSNTIGSYTCACDIGYELNGDGRTCDDIDECATATDECDQVCASNTIGSYTCACDITGYELSGDGRTCDDIDECATATDKCDQVCASNTIGSYTCACDIGYELNGDGRTCDDIDECATATDECDQVCASNTIGSYTCACDVAGYELSGDGRTCDADPDTDIDECATGTDDCDQVCSNTIGSYTCACDIGYELNGDGRTCDDIDECATATDECDQVCASNTIGSYTCACDVAGYELSGDGRTCAVVGVCDSGVLLAEQKFSSTQGGLAGSPLEDWDIFGSSVAAADFDNDGVMDLVVGAQWDDDGGVNRGAVYVLLLNPDQTVKAQQKISSTQGGLVGPLDRWDSFGSSVAVADFDNDGVMDLVVGAERGDDGGTERGVVYVLLLNPDQTVKVEQKISSTQGGLAGPLEDFDRFGSSVAAADFDNDGVMDLVVGAPYDSVGGTSRGSIYVLLLNPDHTVKAEQKMSSTQGGVLNESFGWSVAAADFDNDGVVDLAVGASGGAGAVHVLLLDTDQTVKAEQKIGSGQGGFVGPLDNMDLFGSSLAAADVDSDGVMDLVVGAERDDDGGYDRGAVYVLLLNPDQTVRSEQKLSSTQGGLAGPLDDNDYFGTSVAAWGDLDGNNGVMGLVVGAEQDEDGGTARGAVYMMEVPRGFAPVCDTDETCIDNGDNTYLCEQP